MGCSIWYSEEGPWRAAAPPIPFIAVPNITVYSSTASVPITLLLYNGPLLCGISVAIKGLNPGFSRFRIADKSSTVVQTTIARGRRKTRTLAFYRDINVYAVCDVLCVRLDAKTANRRVKLLTSETQFSLQSLVVTNSSGAELGYGGDRA